MATYKVTGDRPYLGHDPGETFSAELSESQEQRAVDGGAIEVVGGGAAAASPQTGEPTGEPQQGNVTPPSEEGADA